MYLLPSARFSRVYLVTGEENTLIDTGLRETLINSLRIFAVNYFPLLDIPYITGEKEQTGIQKTFGKFFRVKKPQNIRSYISGETAGGIRVIPAPGHTPGHVCFLYHNVRFAGGLLYNKKRALAPYNPAMDWDYGRLKQSVRGVYAYPFEWICPAHCAPRKRGEGVPGDA